jgi:hypothetical protein
MLTYKAPHVVRQYCDCAAGLRQKGIVEKQVKTKDVEPVWELFII